MGKRTDWPSAEVTAEIRAHIREREPDILATHHLIGSEKDFQIVVIQNGRLFDLLADDVYIDVLGGALKAAGKPFYSNVENLLAEHSVTTQSQNPPRNGEGDHA